MKRLKFWVGGAAVVVGAAVSVWAITLNTRTFRAVTSMVGVIQDTNLAGKPQYEFETLQGHDLVNLALGTPLDTVRSNQVMALEVNCDSSAMKLVVYDKAAGSNLVTFATSSSVDVVQQQDNDTAAFPNRERFVARLDVAPTGNATDGFVGGYLTVAGRLHLNPTNGCPRAVLVDADRRQDLALNDHREPRNRDDVDRLVRFAGRAHYIGVLQVVTGGTTNTVLVPNGNLSLRRQLIP